MLSGSGEKRLPPQLDPNDWPQLKAPPTHTSCSVCFSIFTKLSLPLRDDKTAPLATSSAFSQLTYPKLLFLAISLFFFERIHFSFPSQCPFCRCFTSISPFPELCFISPTSHVHIYTDSHANNIYQCLLLMVTERRGTKITQMKEWSSNQTKALFDVTCNPKHIQGKLYRLEKGELNCIFPSSTAGFPRILPEWNRSYEHHTLCQLSRCNSLDFGLFDFVFLCSVFTSCPAFVRLAAPVIVRSVPDCASPLYSNPVCPRVGSSFVFPTCHLLC